MKTQVFENYDAFLNRGDKAINGVSERFAQNYPDYEKMNSTNKGCWNCRYCSYCSNCRYCWKCSNCSDCRKCLNCSNCWNCSDCSDCRKCSNCSDCWKCWKCSNCSDCSDCSSIKNNIPVIENIHTKVLAAATQTVDSLEMRDWHTCKTSHCRAGWVVVLAGEKGRLLENETSALFAAMQIYKKSSDIEVPPTRFYDSKAEALADMKRCAEIERMVLGQNKKMENKNA